MMKLSKLVLNRKQIALIMIIALILSTTGYRPEKSESEDGSIYT